jgi:hypothetical protein
MPVPWFDGGDELVAVLELAFLDFAGAAFALGHFLITGAELTSGPLVAVSAQPAYSLVARDQDVLSFARGLGYWPEVMGHVQISS